MMTVLMVVVVVVVLMVVVAVLMTVVVVGGGDNAGGITPKNTKKQKQKKTAHPNQPDERSNTSVGTQACLPVRSATTFAATHVSANKMSGATCISPNTFTRPSYMRTPPSLALKFEHLTMRIQSN